MAGRRLEAQDGLQRGPHVGQPLGLATVIVSFIKGYALQTMIGLDHSDGRELQEAAETMLRLLARACVADASETAGP